MKTTTLLLLIFILCPLAHADISSVRYLGSVLHRVRQADSSWLYYLDGNTGVDDACTFEEYEAEDSKFAFSSIDIKNMLLATFGAEYSVKPYYAALSDCIDGKNQAAIEVLVPAWISAGLCTTEEFDVMKGILNQYKDFAID